MAYPICDEPHGAILHCVPCDHAQVLALESCYNLRDNFLAALAAGACSGLRHLSLFGCRNVCGGGLAAVLLPLKQLTRLDLGRLGGPAICNDTLVSSLKLPGSTHSNGPNGRQSRPGLCIVTEIG